jgi:hypothetical protein
MGPAAMSLQFVRIVADENIPKEVVEFLRQLGCKEVYWIAEKKKGIPDPEVWKIAISRSAILLTGDLRVIPQLDEADVLNGPALIEYSTRGFAKSELQDPAVMRMLVGWLFQNNHYADREHVHLHVDGTVGTRRKIWQEEKLRRKLSS